MFASWGDTFTAQATATVGALLLIAGVTLLALRLLNIAAKGIDNHIIATVDDLDRRARLHTLRKVFKSGARVIILAASVLTALATLGINIGPALAAAGILGLAISLGAQTLIKDVIGGLTILMEDEFRVGDAVKIGSVSGDVERITLRRTDLRDSEGRVHMLPNGDVRGVANESRGWARALVDFNFAFDTDIRGAVGALNHALARAAGDGRAKPYLLSEPEIFGWNDFSAWSVTVRLRVKVVAGQQGAVSRVIREYALEALQSAGVPLESQTRTVVVGDA